MRFGSTTSSPACARTMRAAPFALGLALAACFATASLAAPPDNLPGPGAAVVDQHYPSHVPGVSTGVPACSAALNNCQALCKPMDGKCVQACDTSHATCMSTGGDTAKK